MALIHADSNGQVFRVTQFPHLDDKYRNAQDASEEMEVDSATNSGLVADIASAMHLYTLAAGVLKKDGRPVSPEEDSDEKGIERSARSVTPAQTAALRQAAKGFMRAIAANGTPTQQQRDRALAYALLRGFLGDNGD